MATDVLELLDQAHAWLDPADVLTWLQLDAGSDQATAAETCRLAAASWCERQRQDRVEVTATDALTGDPTAATFRASASIVQAGILAAARLYGRRSSPTGLASYGDFGPAEVLRLDPDVSRLLGVGRYAPPAVG